jgi:arylformamidase
MSVLIDVSVPIGPRLPIWPDNPPVEIARSESLDAGDGANVSKIMMGAHTGTHMDAPLHFFRDGHGVDTVPLEILVGTARVLDLTKVTSVTVDHLKMHDVQIGERILLKTSNSLKPWYELPFDPGFVSIDLDAADYLADCRTRLIGIDYLSVGGYVDDGAAIHRALLGAGVWILEGLYLGHVAPGVYDLFCSPLKIQEADGAPCRAILSHI